MNKKQDPDLDYFSLQAYIGTTKHMGGFATTQALIDLCGVDQNSRVLEVGCGAGATACYLAKTYGCHVVGIDLREAMVELARERAQKEGVAGQVQFRAASATNLPFDSGTFDVVFCESVLSFVDDKGRAIAELARVAAPGGRVGLNEEIWLKPPPEDLAGYAGFIWDADLEAFAVEQWQAWMIDAGLGDLVVKTFKFDARREATQVKRYRASDMWRMVWRTLTLYLKNPAFRTYMKDRRKLPKGMFDYLGYALFVGKKG
ncbi:MAG: class I SAM-dependent methyltransferase [Anaerolineae bacterium]|nr:class I SAM-dependent methyltransferase [Anaerolineae bacterium]